MKVKESGCIYYLEKKSAVWHLSYRHCPKLPYVYFRMTSQDNIFGVMIITYNLVVGRPAQSFPL